MRKRLECAGRRRTRARQRGHVDQVGGDDGGRYSGRFPSRLNIHRAEFAAAVDAAHEGDARVMVHTWGGDSIDWAIEAGATSIEHGIYMTSSQATRAHDAGMTLVPTLTIYRYVREMVVAGKLGGVPLARIADVVAVHEESRSPRQEAGLPLAVGSDFSTPEQHGKNLVEIGSLMRAGLTSAEALLAATRNGATLLNDPDGA